MMYSYNAAIAQSGIGMQQTTMNAKVTAKVKEWIEGIACWNSARKGRCAVELPTQGSHTFLIIIFHTFSVPF